MAYVAILALVCVAVLAALVYQLVSCWPTDGWGGHVAKILIVVAWLWASLSLMRRIRKK
ncbi:MAG: hypothetical protein ACI35Q_00765 [Marinilabiliaceae bacterium]